MTCKTCGYSWKTRAKHPKKCPNPLCQATLGKYPDPDNMPLKSKKQALPIDSMPSPEVLP
jgi:hypothetical protein